MKPTVTKVGPERGVPHPNNTTNKRSLCVPTQEKHVAGES